MDQEYDVCRIYYMFVRVCVLYARRHPRSPTCVFLTRRFGFVFDTMCVCVLCMCRVVYVSHSVRICVLYSVCVLPHLQPCLLQKRCGYVILMVAL